MTALIPSQKPTDQAKGIKTDREPGRPSMPPGKSWFFGIGINAYAHFPRLNLAVKDIEGLVALLQDQYDLNEECILVLRNEEATRRGIFKGFKRLIRR